MTYGQRLEIICQTIYSDFGRVLTVENLKNAYLIYKPKILIEKRERPYQHDSTASRLLSEVKHVRAWLVLREESQVFVVLILILSLFYFFHLFIFIFYPGKPFILVHHLLIPPPLSYNLLTVLFCPLCCRIFSQNVPFYHSQI